MSNLFYLESWLNKFLLINTKSVFVTWTFCFANILSPKKLDLLYSQILKFFLYNKNKDNLKTGLFCYFNINLHLSLIVYYFNSFLLFFITFNASSKATSIPANTPSAYSSVPLLISLDISLAVSIISTFFS